MSKTYTCASCGGTFQAGWTEAEALAELAREFDGHPVEDCAEVCDDCYKEIMSALKSDAEGA